MFSRTGTAAPPGCIVYSIVRRGRTLMIRQDSGTDVASGDLTLNVASGDLTPGPRARRRLRRCSRSRRSSGRPWTPCLHRAVRRQPTTRPCHRRSRKPASCHQARTRSNSRSSDAPGTWPPSVAKPDRLGSPMIEAFVTASVKRIDHDASSAGAREHITLSRERSSIGRPGGHLEPASRFRKRRQRFRGARQSRGDVHDYRLRARRVGDLSSVR